MNEVEERDLIKKVSQIHTIICDTDGNEGLCTQFRKHCERDDKRWGDYFTFKRNALMFVGFLVGTGLLTVGGIEIAKFFMR